MDETLPKDLRLLFKTSPMVSSVRSSWWLLQRKGRREQTAVRLQMDISNKLSPGWKDQTRNKTVVSSRIERSRSRLTKSCAIVVRVPLMPGTKQLLQRAVWSQREAAFLVQQKANPGAFKLNYVRVAMLKEGILALFKTPKSPQRASLPLSAP